MCIKLLLLYFNRRAVKHHAFQMLQLIAGDRENGVGIDIVAECCSERMEFSTGEVCYIQAAHTTAYNQLNSTMFCRDKRLSSWQ